MTKPLPPPSEDWHLFIVRLWREDSQVEPGGQWRGSVEHVPSGRRAHFLSLDVLNAFITTQLNEEATAESDNTL